MNRTFNLIYEPCLVICISKPLDTHLNISVHSASYTPKPSIYFISLSLLTLHSHFTILLKPPVTTQFSRSNLRYEVHKPLRISIVFTISTSISFERLYVTPYVNNLYTYLIKIKKLHTFRNVSTVVTLTINTQFEQLGR
jgi:hypothetical protein